MLSGKGNAVERGKTAIGLISKKATLHVQHTFFCTFICLCFARLQRETSGNFLVTRFMEEMSYVFSPLHLWPLAFLILSPLLQNFLLFFQQKNASFVCFSLSPFFLIELRLSAAYFSFFLYFSVSIFQICGHDN